MSKTPPSVPTERPKASGQLTEADIEGLKQLAEDIKYSGFDPVRLRPLIISKVPAVDLIKILTVAAQVGNNPSRLLGKINNPDQGRNMQALLAKYKIKAAGATLMEDLTLARVAMTMAPLFLAVRRTIKDSLQDQDFGTGLAKEWQSPTFSMLFRQGNAPFDQWMLMFGRAIKPRGWDDQKSDQNTALYAGVAVAAKQKDPFMSTDNFGKSIPELVAILYR